MGCTVTSADGVRPGPPTYLITALPMPLATPTLEEASRDTPLRSLEDHSASSPPLQLAGAHHEHQWNRGGCHGRTWRRRRQ